MEITSLQNLTLIFVILLFTFYFLIFNPSKSKSTSQSGFKNYPILGTLPEFLLNRHRFLDWSTEILSKCTTNTAVFTRPGKINGVITANPLNAEHVLKTNFENYPKGTRFISLLQDFLGCGIFNSDGDTWRAQRKTVSHEFNTRSLRNFVIETVAVELHTWFIPALVKAANMNHVVDLQELIEIYSFDNICKVAFNVDPGCLSGDGTSGSEFMKAFDEAATPCSGRFMYVLPDHIIKSRMDAKDEKTEEDLLSRFMGNSEYSPEFLRDIIISFILAGRDTTSSALAWFFWILSFHNDVKVKILKELETIRSRSGKSYGEFYNFDELRQMNYLHAAISEGLKLYPPVPVDTKACLKDDVLPDGTFVGKDWFVTYHTYAMGRMKSIWGKDCCQFRPGRWLEEDNGANVLVAATIIEMFEVEVIAASTDKVVEEKSPPEHVLSLTMRMKDGPRRWLEEDNGANVVCRQENSFKYPVFHGGPRICLGKEMAYTQMKLVATMIIEMFEVEVIAASTDKVVEEKNPPEHVLSLTMRMKDGLKVRLRKR
nr:cytochrome P450 94A1-like [Tanacetum cinerariifolium]